MSVTNLERRLSRLEQLHGTAEDTDAILAEMTDLELADVQLAITQSLIDDPGTAPDERQRMFDEMAELAGQRVHAAYWSKWDRRPSRLVDQLLRRLFPGFQPPGGERVTA